MKESQTYQQICSLLPALSRTEARQLIAQLKVLSSTGKEEIDYDDWLLDSLIRELKRRNLVFPRPQERQAYKSYSKHAGRIRESFESKIPRMTKAEKLRLGALISKCYARYLESWTMVCLDTLLLNINKLEAAVSRGFPGYQESGMLRLLVGRP